MTVSQAHLQLFHKIAQPKLPCIMPLLEQQKALQTMNPNQSKSVLGTRAYHMGHIFTFNNTNGGHFVGGKRLTRKANGLDERMGFSIPRAAMIYVDHKLSNACLTDEEFIGQRIFYGVITNTIGTAFALRAIDSWLSSDTLNNGDSTFMQTTRARILARARKQLATRKRLLNRVLH